MKRVLTALTGLFGLALLLVGVPVVLWTVGQGVLASGAIPSSLSELGAALTERDSGRLFLAVLLSIGALAWAFLVVGFLLELPAAVRRRPARQIRGFGWAQRATGVLLVMIIAGAPGIGIASAATAAPPLTAITSAVSATGAGIVQASAPKSIRAAPTATSGLPTVHQMNTAGRPTYVVQPRDTLWGIAERVLGDGARAQQILALNNGIRQADGGALEATSFPRPGWVLVLPSDAKTPPPSTVQVEPGDTLTSLAQERLGDASRYGELAAANGIADPDLIDAGAVLTIPAQPTPTVPQIPQQPSAPASTTPPAQDTTAASPAVPADTTPEDSSASTVVEQQNPASPAPTPNAATEVAQTPDAASNQATPVDPAAETSPTVTATVLPAPPAAAGNAEAAADQSTSTDSSQDNLVATAATWIGVTAITAAAIWAGIAAAQRRGARRRRRGQIIAFPREPAIRTERTLRAAAASVDMPWLDMALRSLSVVDVDQLPDITGAEFSPAGLRLLLATETPAPSPFLADGPTWWLPAAAPLPITTSDTGDQPAPLPALTSIGSDGDTTVMLDLEAAGALSVTGDPEGIRGLLRHLVVELAHQSWSDEIDVLLVGWGQQLTALNPDRLTVADDIPTALAYVGQRAQAVGMSLQGMDLSIRDARIEGTDTWAPQIVIVNHAAADTQQLHDLTRQIDELSRSGHAATAIVVAGDALPNIVGTRLTVQTDGTMVVSDGWGGQRAITAATLTQAELDDLLHLLSELNENGPSSSSIAHPQTAPWAQDMDLAGGLLPPVDLTEPVDVVTSEHVGVNDDQVQPAPAASAALVAAQAADPALDDDLREWQSDEIDRPRISVLGPVQVHGRGDLPTRRAWFSEVAVYLALHRQGIGLDKFADDLWAGRPVNPKTRNETVSRVRAWLGGALYVPMAGKSGVYQLLPEQRLLDAELFTRLRKRGDAYAAAHRPADALQDYLSALSLVRGEPMPEVDTAGSGWAWMLNSGRRDHLLLPGMISDCAHRAVAVALASKPAQLEAAREAANRAHLAEPGSELPLLDLLVIAAAEGDMDTAQRRAWQTLAAVGVEAVEDIPDHETFKIIDRIFPHGLRAVSNR